MTNFYTLQINWDAFSAIGSWFGAIATFSAAIIALYPYFKKVKLYFTLNSNIEPNPVLNIINSKSESIFIEEINFFAGPAIFKRCIFKPELHRFLIHQGAKIFYTVGYRICKSACSIVCAL